MYVGNMPSEPMSDSEFEQLERSVRQGLGPEAGLVDILTDSEQVRIFAESSAGKVIIRDCAKRCVAALEDLTLDICTPDTERHALLALRLNIGILRRMAALVAAGSMAEQAIADRLDAPSERPGYDD